ncbi:MAG: LysM peptidoglycan-binding domain-containing protein [Candidatus Cloacimonetes bacterium]|nr:LysM peptidoglycan-binding domain-containing protein [Candidatus Cloacimonadota bacterium]
MSAFNAGAGSIARVIRQQEAYDFFDLLMRVDETHQYVWRAAAIKMIFENEEAIFGKKFERFESILTNAHQVKIKLKGHYKIDNWAKAQGTTIGKVLELNPWINIYKRTRKKYSAINNVVLPPGEYFILIPKGNNINYENLAKIEKQFLKKNAGFFTHHIVKKGDTLYDIAKKYKTTVYKIKYLNGLKSNIIRPGQKLKLYGSPKSSSKEYYVVKKGDTLSGIARKCSTSISKLKSINGLKSNTIYPGQKLFY